MTIRIAINHNTYYKFDRPVNLSPHTIRLRPAPHSRTPIKSYSLKVEPQEHFINWQQDAFGNFLASFVFPEKTTHLSIEVEVIADMKVINPFDFFLAEYAEEYPFTYTPQLKKDLSLYLEKKINGKAFNDLVSSIDLTKRRTIDFLVDINSMLEKRIDYLIRMEPGVQTPKETLDSGKGSCRDSAWLLVQILRHLGLAARFASGYLVQLTPDEKSLDGPSGPEKDFTDLHAWCEVFLPGAGWVGLDPTSGLFAGEGHIPLACTPNPVSAAPIEGATDKCEVDFAFTNEVTRIHEDPRVTKPYTDEQWSNVLALGNKVDAQLVQDDVRLTMGGEPTFVSIDDMDGAQWNTAALGEEKLRLAKSLLLGLRDHFAPSGLLHYGQGKWYPGEEVPRWALGVFWRKDGESLWSDGKYLARIDKDYGHDYRTAHKFSTHLASLLGIEKDYIQPAFEDALHYLLQEQKLPKNMDVLASNILSSKSDSDLGRRRLAKLLEKGFNKPAGFVIPIEWDSQRQAWHTSTWEFKRERLILIPGDSPLGLRIPLNDLPWFNEHEVIVERDPFEVRDDLIKPAEIQFPAQAYATSAADLENQTQVRWQTVEEVNQSHEEYKEEPVSNVTAEQQKTKEKAAQSHKVTSPVVRTAICIEPRDGKLHIFMPPLWGLENYVELVKALEETAKKFNAPIIIEGYEPPKDHRLQKLLVTPDPGVIEVNIHPANNWNEMVSNMEALYEAAKHTRLGTEKFMLDGRHTGTGGGNHITLGGPTPADSPMLRRPDLLRSFVTFWQHHPSLSYVFSGAFIGPTSQAPRADEGRDEMLYEMEIAFDQMPDGETNQPWLIDRVMRNLLIDVTGNTHRAEFCIDKLYAPGSSTGRLGLLEFRGFEMPPHSRMALVQALLIRTLVARFWRNPYKHRLVRWGTMLHDKYMLPHFLWEDMKEVVADLRENGYEFDVDWLLPFEEFRFPHYGRVNLDGIEIELRWAVEPWHVLGEEVGSFGTARYVDSSVERLQVKVSGIADGRYVLACNGRRVPMHKTQKQGEYVGGVRYRAWAPPSALHPTIGVHTPLVFDLIDTWNGRSLGGCSYHVSHPGGRSYDNFPVNAYEAESRRINRFEDIGHTPGPLTPRPDVNAMREFFTSDHPPRPMAPPPEETPGEYPYTLDLRRKASFIG